MDNIIVVFVLLIPGYFGLLVFEFITGIRAKNQLTRNVTSIFLGLIALLELNLWSKGINYVTQNFITVENPVIALVDPRLIWTLIFLTLLSIATSFLVLVFKSILNVLLKWILKRSLDQSLLFSLLSKYSQKTTKKEPIRVYVKLKTGNYIYGVYKRASDDISDPYMYLVDCVELDGCLKTVQRLDSCQDKTEDGILLNLRDCDYVGFNFTDKCIQKTT